MQDIVTIQDFNTPYLIGLELENNFQEFIQGEQEDVLKELLGLPLYKAFEEGLEENIVDLRWKELLDGVEYKINVRTYEWKGMKKILVPYLYAKYYSETIYQLNGLSAGQVKVENSEIINPAHKIARANNAYARMVGLDGDDEDTLFGFLFWSDTKYADVVQPDYSSIQSYIIDNFQCPSTMNTLNI